MKRSRSALLIVLTLWLSILALGPLAGGPAPSSAAGSRLQPADLTYLGAFRLPAGGERPLTFEYGGSAMTVNPDGDPAGAADGFAGSLFVMGHDRMAYGELPDGNQVAEVTIPAPVIAADASALPQAAFVQDFHDVAAGYFVGLDEIPRVGLLYLDTPATGPVIHVAWGQHFQEGAALETGTHAWFSPDLAAPAMQGPWFLADITSYATTGYLLDIPAAWADAHTGGRRVGAGRFRDGGWSGMGPSLIAYQPWIDASGTPAPAGSTLDAIPLLLYAASTETDDVNDRSMDGYQHPDEWMGAAWLATADGAAAVLFAGTKSAGDRYWYGFVNPAGPDSPCVEEELAGEFTLCRQADGTPCPPDEMTECEGHTSGRGWWSSRFEAQFIFYDPADLARVAAGELAPWEPQPYAVLPVDEHLLLPTFEPESLGAGVQRRARISDAAYDRVHQRLYVLELFADGASPVVHVWQVGA